jgi:ABC-type metal ion transport system substrate-binding protein
VDAKIGIPNDPSNEARALLLLAAQKIITLTPAQLPGLLDISANPKHIHFIEMDAAQLLAHLVMNCFYRLQTRYRQLILACNALQSH